MTTYKRAGNKWTINETLQLQREYELLEWNVPQIAEKHQRSVESIMYKLESEGFIDSWKSARGYYCDEDNINFVLNNLREDNGSEYFGSNENISEEEKIDSKLTDRVGNLEISVKEIASMVRQILSSVTEKNIQNNSSRNKLYY